MTRDREKDEKRAEELLSCLNLRDMISLLRYDSPSIRKAGIPSYNWWNEGLHGAARSGTATVFPQAIALAAMFDEKAMERIGYIVSTEQRAKYNVYSSKGDRGIYKGLTVWSPNVNIFRDPRWGRGQETYGEDPVLASCLAVAFIKGLQHGKGCFCTSSGIKHFAAHSGPEPIRHHFNVVASEKDLEETYFPAFKAAVREAGVEGMMGAYTMLNGEPCCGHPLIDSKIRGDWGFDGIFYSDCWAIRDFHEQHRITKSPEESAAKALKAGCDLNCGCTYQALEAAFSKGLITREDIRRSAKRALLARIRLGLFDEGTEFDSLGFADIATRENQKESLEASRRSVVLLENRDGFLPLGRESYHSIAVIGPNADSRAALWGNYHGTSQNYITLLEGVRSVVGEDTRIFYSQGSAIAKEKVERLAESDDRIAEAVIAAESSELVILALGLDEVVEGEMHDDGNGGIAGDKKDLRLPECQRRLLEAVAGTGRPIVLVLLSGGALDPEIEQYDNVKALLQGWYPGESGGRAIAEIIFGLVNPSGKLPVTFYRSSEVLPDYQDYSMKGRTYRYFENEPLYPFGYGLSYTRFHYSDATCRELEDAIRIAFDLENTGKVCGEEVSFIWASCESPDCPPRPFLAGFARTALDAGEKKRVEVTIPLERLSLVDDGGRRYRKDGSWRLYAAGSQVDEYSLGLSASDIIEMDMMLKEEIYE